KQVDRNFRVINGAQRLADLVIMYLTITTVFVDNFLGFQAQCRRIGAVNTQHIAVVGDGVITAQRLINGDETAGRNYRWYAGWHHAGGAGFVRDDHSFFHDYSLKLLRS